jgi:hypothetical protein
MKKVLLTLCGAVLLMTLGALPALAQVGKNYQTPMMCGPFGGAFVERGYAVILRPAGNLFISLLGLASPVNTPFSARIICSGSPQPFPDPPTPAGFVGPGGKLKVIVPGIATAAGLGLPPGVECRDIRIEVFDPVALNPMVVPRREFCTEGFTP